MKAGLLYGVRDLRLVEIPVPQVKPRSVLLKVLACGVCPTDLRKYHTADNGKLRLPMNLGHEFVGEVVKIGPDVDNFEPGMRVLGDGFVGYAEYALLDLELQPPVHVPLPIVIPMGISDEAATFAEPLADCIHAIREQGAVKSGSKVVIIGGGTMGQLLMMVAKALGGYVILSEPDPYRRSVASMLGADCVIDPASTDIAKAVHEITNKEGVDAAILSIGVVDLVPAVMEMVRPCGRVVLFGRFPSEARGEIDLNLIHSQEITLTGSYWIGAGACANTQLYRDAIELLASNTIDVNPLISQRLSLSQINKAFSIAGQMDTFKVIVRPWS